MNIIENKSINEHIEDKQNVAKINETAASLAPDQSEIEQADLTLVESEKVPVPGIKDAKIRFECTLENNIELARDTNICTNLILVKIVQYHINDSLYEHIRE